MAFEIPDLEGFERHYGIRIADVGEDGAVIALGHHEPRRTIAAFRRHARVVWGSQKPTSISADPVWAVLDPSCPEHPHCADAYGLDPGQPCPACTDRAEAPWWIRWGVDPLTPGAFPVMVWES